MKSVLAIDLGTTGNRVIAFTRDGGIAAKSYYEFPQIFPKPGWVEHDPLDIWNTTRKALKDVLGEVGAENVVSIGITNQRETTILWDRTTGKPYYNAIVWQCRRTADMCKKLSASAAMIRRKTGLFLDPYFSATKIKWIIENVRGVREGIRSGRAVFGTVDTWILWNLTGGRIHATEPSNASRTMLFNIRTLSYDRALLKLFGVPEEILPEVRDSGGDFGTTDRRITGKEIPITGILGDQQASLFAQGGWEEGMVKNTYGTGLFLVAPTARILKNPGTLVSTVAWKRGDNVCYAVEGSVFVGGSCIQWLRDGLKIIRQSPDTEPMAKTLKSNEGVYFVPALAGLGAPYWDPSARGMIIGITRGTCREHIARAALEAIAYQVKDVIDAMKQVTGRSFKTLRVDGGAAKNDFLMQFQSDILDLPVERPKSVETTAFGAAGMAGITSGFWTLRQFAAARRIDTTFMPHMRQKQRTFFYARWKEAVGRALRWVE